MKSFNVKVKSGVNKMKPLCLVILICLISLTAFAQELHYSGEGKVTISLGKEEKEDYQTKEDILKAYGEPFYKGGHQDVDVWYYPEPYRMFIFFDKDKVVRIDVVTGEKI